MSNYLPFAAYLMSPRRRRNALLPIAIPSMGNLPAAQVGALSVVSADAALRREQAATTTAVALADQAAEAAVHDTIRIAVENGAKLSVDKFPEGSIGRRLADAVPDLFEPVGQISDEALDRLADLVAEKVQERQAAATNKAAATSATATATAGQPGTWDTAGGSNPPATIDDLVNAPHGTFAASPTAPWKTGEYVETATSGASGYAYWDGTAWQKGTAP